MVINKAPRYRVDLPDLQATCALNYAQLRRLLPLLEEPHCQRLIRLSHSPQQGAQIDLQAWRHGPYTSELSIALQSLLAWLTPLRLQVRAYHDAQLAEVVAVASGRLKPRYSYPNEQMCQPDEKRQLNRYLGQWLAQAQRFGEQSLHSA